MRRLPTLFLPLLAACGGYSLVGDFGATPGGAQDIGYARDLIWAGEVPPADTITVGGLLNEHSMPIEGDRPCGETLCIVGASGAGRIVADDEDSLLVQVGYDSNLNEVSFRRQPVNLAIVIDKSGSMSEELDDLRTALHAMTDQLQPDDRVAIITYGTFAKVLMSPTLADDPDKIHRKIDRIKAGGSTAMEGGLRLGYDTIDRFETADVESRVMLFTDVQPNVGATESTEFEDIVRDGAEQGIHLTLFGLGYQFGHGLALDISDLRGGNYYSLPDGSTAIDLFEDEFEFMVTPLAFDLQMRVDSPYGYVDGYNIQGSTVGVGATVDVSVSTIFLSRRHGASILRLELPDEAIPAGTEVASLQLAYEDAHTAATVEDDFTVSFPSAGEGLEGDLFEQPGTRKATALVNMGLGMIALCEGSDSTGTEGVASAYWEMRDRLATEAEVLGDQALADEVALVDKLAENAGLVLEQ